MCARTGDPARLSFCDCACVFSTAPRCCLQLRERIINDGAIAPLVKLLHKTEIKDAQRSDGVVAAAAAAVWNLTAHQNAKPIVLRERAVEALVAQLRESRSPDVWQKCAGCLMVLAANSDKVSCPDSGRGVVPSPKEAHAGHQICSWYGEFSS